MRVEFTPLPGESLPRPVVKLRFTRVSGASLPVLVDSGASAIRMPIDWAAVLGVDPSAGASSMVTIGGAERLGNEVDVDLSLGKWTWTAPVTFLHSWDLPHGVVGLRGFFDQFAIRFDAAIGEMTILKARHRPAAAAIG